MSVINTNVKSLVAQNALTVNNRAMSKAMEQLSTGKRINTAADDAAGLAISTKMTAQIRGLNQAVRNANDAISVIQTAEGATQEITNMLQRMRELAVQSANDTYTAEDRAALGDEYKQLGDEITRIADSTQFNSMNLFTKTNSSAGGIGATGLATFQIGANSGTAFTIDVQFEKMDGATLFGNTAPAAADINTHSASQGAIADIDTALETVDEFRSDLGSKINRLNYAVDNMTATSTNTAASRSRIQDTDYAQATTELARTQIIQQAATAMLAQANQQPASVLSLLQ
jgi:flagellin